MRVPRKPGSRRRLRRRERTQTAPKRGQNLPTSGRSAASCRMPELKVERPVARLPRESSRGSLCIRAAFRLPANRFKPLFRLEAVFACSSACFKSESGRYVMWESLISKGEGFGSNSFKGGAGEKGNVFGRAPLRAKRRRGVTARSTRGPIGSAPVPAGCIRLYIGLKFHLGRQP